MCIRDRAHSAGRRRGTAARVERIIPVEYSPVMTSTPRTTTASCARSAARVNTKMLLPLASCPVSCDATTAENNVTIPTIKKTVIPSVQTVERRVRNLIHSDLTMRGKLSRMSPVAGLACEGVAVGGIMTLVLIGLRLPCWPVQGPGRGGQSREQVVVCAAPGVHRLGVEQRADLLHGGAVLVVAPAVDGHRAARGVVQTDDQPHRGGLPGAVRAEETGDFAGLHGERDIVHGRLGSITPGKAVGLDHRWGSFVFVGRFNPEARWSPGGLPLPPLAAFDCLQPLLV